MSYFTGSDYFLALYQAVDASYKMRHKTGALSALLEEVSINIIWRQGGRANCSRSVRQ